MLVYTAKSQNVNMCEIFGYVYTLYVFPQGSKQKIWIIYV